MQSDFASQLNKQQTQMYDAVKAGIPNGEGVLLDMLIESLLSSNGSRVRSRLTPSEREWVIRAYAEGKTTITRIAESVGLTYGGVVAILRKEGLHRPKNQHKAATGANGGNS